MKKEKIIYWTTTLLVCLLGAAPAITYFTMPQAVEGFKHVGFPDYFRIELGVGKLVGMLILLIPAVSARVKEWAYVGFGITYISAFIAHLAVDGIANTWGPVLAFTLLLASYIYFHKLQAANK
ncbi:MAG: DoxX family protein [Sphingobacteriaceae bacterium]